jgi:hypothetical protein
MQFLKDIEQPGIKLLPFAEQALHGSLVET